VRVLTSDGVRTDAWVRLSDEAPLAAGADLVVSYSRWTADAAKCAAHTGRIAVCLAPDDDVAEVARHLDRFDLVAIEFPEFADGRGFSQARLLREAYGYRGELRAVGEFLRDQLYFMARCGFDSFELRADQDPGALRAAFTEFSVRYQPAADGAPTIRTLRSSAP
jgi:uncharacterized protein (DUF934 family)